MYQSESGSCLQNKPEVGEAGPKLLPRMSRTEQCQKFYGPEFFATVVNVGFDI